MGSSYPIGLYVLMHFTPIQLIILLISPLNRNYYQVSPSFGADRQPGRTYLCLGEVKGSLQAGRGKMGGNCQFVHIRQC
jgi:hypothetical protein